MDFQTLDALRKRHPAWRLLHADSAPFVASFLQRSFVEPNLRTIAQPELVAKLDDCLFHLRERLGEDAFPRRASEYLNDWAAEERGWLRKYYPPGSDEPHFDLMPATEKALAWLAGLRQRQFVGTESRLITVFQLLRQMRAGIRQALWRKEKTREWANHGPEIGQFTVAQPRAGTSNCTVVPAILRVSCFT